MYGCSCPDCQRVRAHIERITARTYSQTISVEKKSAPSLPAETLPKAA